MAAKTLYDDPETSSVNEAGTANASAAVHAVTARGSAAALAAENSRDDDDDDDEDDEDDKDTASKVASVVGDGDAKKKKKNKKNKNKKKSKKTLLVQTDPPSITIAKLFPNSTYPKGEEAECRDENRRRTTAEEVRHVENILNNEECLADFRHAAETHRQVRRWAREHIRPGQSLTDIATGIEDSVRRLVGHDGLAEGDALVAGMGFPTGLNLNNIAAHFSPNLGNTTVLAENNIFKVDIGVHVNGRIVDSAFTMSFDPIFDPLIAAVRDATDTGVREAGIDVRLGELGALIQETMESYECKLHDGITYPIKPVRNIGGHTIMPYSIHGTKHVPCVRSDDDTRMEEGDVFAIETFGTTGTGRVWDQGEVSHYALRADAPREGGVAHASARALLAVIRKNFGTLPFCRRYLDRIGQEKYLFGLNHLVKAGIVEDYPPLVDKKGSYSAQFEHTILLRPTVKEVISRGDDY